MEAAAETAHEADKYHVPDLHKYGFTAELLSCPACGSRALGGM